MYDPLRYVNKAAENLRENGFKKEKEEDCVQKGKTKKEREKIEKEKVEQEFENGTNTYVKLENPSESSTPLEPPSLNFHHPQPHYPLLPPDYLRDHSVNQHMWKFFSKLHPTLRPSMSPPVMPRFPFMPPHHPFFMPPYSNIPYNNVYSQPFLLPTLRNHFSSCFPLSFDFQNRDSEDNRLQVKESLSNDTFEKGYDDCPDWKKIEKALFEFKKGMVHKDNEPRNFGNFKIDKILSKHKDSEPTVKENPFYNHFRGPSSEKVKKNFVSKDSRNKNKGLSVTSSSSSFPHPLYLNREAFYDGFNKQYKFYSDLWLKNSIVNFPKTSTIPTKNFINKPTINETNHQQNKQLQRGRQEVSRQRKTLPLLYHNFTKLSKPQVRLEGIDLWERFHQVCTEMVITKNGRLVVVLLHSSSSFLLFIPPLHSSSSFLLFIPPLQSSSSFLLFIPPLHSSFSFLLFIPSLHSSSSFLLFIPPLHSSSSFLLFIPPLHSSSSFLLFIPPLHSSSSFLLFIPPLHSSSSFLLFITPLHSSSSFLLFIPPLHSSSSFLLFIPPLHSFSSFLLFIPSLHFFSSFFFFIFSHFFFNFFFFHFALNPSFSFFLANLLYSSSLFFLSILFVLL